MLRSDYSADENGFVIYLACKLQHKLLLEKKHIPLKQLISKIYDRCDVSGVPLTVLEGKNGEK